jgi:prevent-host-death family protein
MELSVREAKARFAEAMAAAERGERVVLTRHGHPVVEMIPARKQGGIDWDKLEKIRRELGIDPKDYELPENFDDPAFSRRVLGLED